MTPIARETLKSFLRVNYSDLLKELACLTITPLQVTDPQGEVLVAGLHGQQDDSAKPANSAERLDQVPIKMNGETYGFVTFPSDQAQCRTVVESLASQIGRHYSTVCDLDHMTSQLSDSFDEINLLYRFSEILHPDRNISSTFRNLMRETAELLEGRILVLHDAQKGHFEWSNATGSEFNAMQQWLSEHPPKFASVFERLIEGRAKGPLAARVPGSLDTPHGPAHYTLSPVRTHEELSGFVAIVRGESEPPFETGELRLLECLAEELSSATTARHLYQELQDMLFNTVKSLVAAVDAKDEYTRGHSERVYQLSILLGEQLELGADDQRSLSWAALLHDVGKIAIGREILNKPGRLTNEEFAVIKTHPERGVRVLEPIPQLQKILPVIMHHHERYDGNGYPAGLEAEDIPLASRIIAVADTFDAMASSRAYRPAQDLEVVLDEIKRCTGTQFDPHVAEAFLELAKSGKIAEIMACQTEEGGDQKAA